MNCTKQCLSALYGHEQYTVQVKEWGQMLYLQSQWNPLYMLCSFIKQKKYKGFHT